ncbi:MAG: hypothetical protein RL757_3054 [Bacteroidota bacterium]|jgi:hypothetical protein
MRILKTWSKLKTFFEFGQLFLKKKCELWKTCEKIERFS